MLRVSNIGSQNWIYYPLLSTDKNCNIFVLYEDCQVTGETCNNIKRTTNTLETWNFFTFCWRDQTESEPNWIRIKIRDTDFSNNFSLGFSMSFLQCYITVRIRIIGFLLLTKGSGCGYGRHKNIRIRIRNTGTFTSFFKDKKSKRSKKQ